MIVIVLTTRYSDFIKILLNRGCYISLKLNLLKLFRAGKFVLGKGAETGLSFLIRPI